MKGWSKNWYLPRNPLLLRNANPLPHYRMISFYDHFVQLLLYLISKWKFERAHKYHRKLYREIESYNRLLFLCSGMHPLAFSLLSNLKQKMALFSVFKKSEIFYWYSFLEWLLKQHQYKNSLKAYINILKAMQSPLNASCWGPTICVGPILLAILQISLINSIHLTILIGEDCWWF